MQDYYIFVCLLDDFDQKKMEELRLAREKSLPKPPSTDSFWDSSSVSDEIAHKKTKPEYDLSQNCTLAKIRSLTIEGTPQSVCRNTNENLDLTYVTDIEGNKIWMFAGFVHTGNLNMKSWLQS